MGYLELIRRGGSQCPSTQALEIMLGAILARMDSMDLFELSTVLKAKNTGVTAYAIATCSVEETMSKCKTVYENLPANIQ